MKIFILAYAILGLILSASSIDYEDRCPKTAVSDDPCGLTGTWQNELGSTAEFTCADGQLNGIYTPVVGLASYFYNLTGRYMMSGPYENVTMVGWTVAYNNNVTGNSNRTCSWTGIYYPNVETLFTKYILMEYVDQSNLSQSSYTSTNIFLKVC